MYVIFAKMILFSALNPMARMQDLPLLGGYTDDAAYSLSTLFTPTS